MIVPIQSVMIMAVDRTTSFRDIVRAFSRYATVSHISVDGFETKVGGKYNRVYVTIDSWHDTEDAYKFIKQIRSGCARLNYWWDIRNNTSIEQVEQQVKVELDYAIEKELLDRLESEISALLEEEDDDLDSLITQDTERTNWVPSDFISGDVFIQEHNDWMDLSNAIDYFRREGIVSVDL